MSRTPRSVLLSLRFYRLLLGAYPRSFRDEFNEPMAQMFHDLAFAAHTERGLAGLVALWLRILVDFVPSVLRTHREVRGSRASLFSMELAMSRKLSPVLGWLLIAGAAIGGSLSLPVRILEVSGTGGAPSGMKVQGEVGPFRSTLDVSGNGDYSQRSSWALSWTALVVSVLVLAIGLLLVRCRPGALLTILGGLLVVSLVILWDVKFHLPDVSAGNFDKIKVGMPQQEVEAILGPWEETRGFIHGGFFTSNGKLYPPDGTGKSLMQEGEMSWGSATAWNTDRRAITLQFRDGKVAAKSREP